MNQIWRFQLFRGIHTTRILNINKGDKIGALRPHINEKPETPKPKKLDSISIVNAIKPGKRDDKQIFKNDKVPDWKKQKLALRQKFGENAWSPSKKLSREEMESVRLLKKQMPFVNNSQIAEHFKVSPEAIRRILKSSWQPGSLEEEEEVQERWKRRGERIDKMRTQKDQERDSVFMNEKVKRTKVIKRKKVSQRIKGLGLSEF